MMGENRQIKIGLLTAFTPSNRLSWASWSDTIFHMIQALQKHCGEVRYIVPGGYEQKQNRRNVGKSLQKLLYKRLKRSLRDFSVLKYLFYEYCFSISKKYVRVATPLLAESSFDVIVAPASSIEVALLETEIPILLIEDATFKLLHNYYSQYSKLPKKTSKKLDAIAGLAITKASSLVYSSAWAARSAVEDYRADRGKVHVVPSGANLDSPPPKEVVQQRKRSERCRLLFIGVDWRRKGGDIAFETLAKLEEMGVQAELIVCGCTPPKEFAHEWMTVIPFLNKKDEKQRSELEQLYVRSDFLLLPTRSECYGMVFCEANAFGLPVITTRTGGVPEVIRDGENGFTLPLSARGTEYAELIAQIYRDEQQYTKLVRSSRAAFDDRLNWDAWGIAVGKIITEMLDHEQRHVGSTSEQLTPS